MRSNEREDKHNTHQLTAINCRTLTVTHTFGMIKVGHSVLTHRH